MNPSDTTVALPSVTSKDSSGLRDIVIVKEDRFVASSLERIVSMHFPEAKVITFHEGIPALRALRERSSSLVLMGLTFADFDGIALAITVRQELLVPKLLVVSSRFNECINLAVRTIPADGFFSTKLEDPEMLPVVVRNVLRGGQYYSANDAPGAGFHLGRPLHMVLTPSEFRIFLAVGVGKDEKTISSDLNLSVHTVRRHLQDVRSKLRAHSRAELILEAIQRGFVRVRLGQRQLVLDDKLLTRWVTSRTQ